MDIKRPFLYDFLFLTGEWFIGCVIMLYVISPIVFHVMNTFTFKRKHIFFICDNNYNIPNIKYLIIIFKLPILVFCLPTS